MINELETNLYLPIRFYNTIAEQDRYKPHVIGVSFIDLNYPYADQTVLAPFQVILQYYCATIDSIELYIICTDTLESVTLDVHLEHWEVYVDTVNEITYLSYLGNDDFSGLIGKGLHHLQLGVTDDCSNDSNYYSDYFMVDDLGGLAGIVEYRYLQSGELRGVNVNDLRIT
jgi:hypothetical protein